jgi:hypothetical protein
VPFYCLPLKSKAPAPKLFPIESHLIFKKARWSLCCDLGPSCASSHCVFWEIWKRTPGANWFLNKCKIWTL